jgi:hypothetical protein
MESVESSRITEVFGGFEFAVLWCEVAEYVTRSFAFPWLWPIGPAPNRRPVTFRANMQGKLTGCASFFQPPSFRPGSTYRRTRLGKSATATAAFVSLEDESRGRLPRLYHFDGESGSCLGRACLCRCSRHMASMSLAGA